MCIFAADRSNMTEQIQNLEPTSVWRCFTNLNRVPRPSKNEDKVIEFMVAFGQSLGLETIRDSVGNVIIRKPATKGMENRKPIILQAHLDMVHQKNAATIFDFETQGIPMYVEGDWVKAHGTTLGADNGLGVAAIMAVLQSGTILHPSLEALFTIDEETGMTGAKGLEAGILEGEILLNLDTEEDDEIDIGCAGGVDITAVGQYTMEPAEEDFLPYILTVSGLQGGHSGTDIHKGFGNANKIMNQMLSRATEMHKLRISSINGGGLRNAIPRESTACIAVPKALHESFERDFGTWVTQIKMAYAKTEPGLILRLDPGSEPESLMDLAAQKNMLSAIASAHNGVYRMSASIDGLVESSNNVARVEVGAGSIYIGNLARSSDDKVKLELAQALRDVFEVAGLEVHLSGEYPGWSPNPRSVILQVLSTRYETLFGIPPRVVACHAGLECGILGSTYPDLDMISFGPTIKGAHSPDERVQVSSVRKFWKLLLDILEHIPVK